MMMMQEKREEGDAERHHCYNIDIHSKNSPKLHRQQEHRPRMPARTRNCRMRQDAVTGNLL